MSSKQSLGQMLKDSGTSELMLWEIPLEQRQYYYSELCEFVRWALERQRDDHRLVQFEKDLTDFANHLEDKVKLGELSEDKANELKANRIWIIAHEESKHAPPMLAIWEPRLPLDIDNSSFEELIERHRKIVEREFKEKLEQCLGLGEV